MKQVNSKKKSKSSTRPKTIKNRCNGITMKRSISNKGRPCEKAAMTNGYCYKHQFQYKSNLDKKLFDLEDELDDFRAKPVQKSSSLEDDSSTQESVHVAETVGFTTTDCTLNSPKEISQNDTFIGAPQTEKDVSSQMNQSAPSDLNELIDDTDNSGEVAHVLATVVETSLPLPQILSDSSNNSTEDMDISEAFANAIYNQILKNSIREMKEKMNASLNAKFNQLMARLNMPSELKMSTYSVSQNMNSVNVSSAGPRDNGALATCEETITPCSVPVNNSSNAPKQLHQSKQQPADRLTGITKPNNIRSAAAIPSTKLKQVFTSDRAVIQAARSTNGSFGLECLPSGRHDVPVIKPTRLTTDSTMEETLAYFNLPEGDNKPKKQEKHNFNVASLRDADQNKSESSLFLTRNGVVVQSKTSEATKVTDFNLPVELVEFKGQGKTLKATLADFNLPIERSKPKIQGKRDPNVNVRNGSSVPGKRDPNVNVRNGSSVPGKRDPNVDVRTGLTAKVPVIQTTPSNTIPYGPRDGFNVMVNENVHEKRSGSK